MRTKLILALSLACAGHAASLTFGLLDPANVAFCTDPDHPVCVELTNIAFTGLPNPPDDVAVQDGSTTIYSFSNIYYSVDPGGLTFSGGIAPNEPFSISNAQQTDLQNGQFQLEVAGDIAVSLFGEEDVFSSAPPPTAPDPMFSTPEPCSAALALLGLTAAVITRQKEKNQ